MRQIARMLCLILFLSLVLAVSVNAEQTERIFSKIVGQQLIVIKERITTKQIHKQAYPLPGKDLIGDIDLDKIDFVYLIHKKKKFLVSTSWQEVAILQSRFPFFYPKDRKEETLLGWDGKKWFLSKVVEQPGIDKLIVTAFLIIGVLFLIAALNRKNEDKRLLLSGLLVCAVMFLTVGASHLFSGWMLFVFVLITGFALPLFVVRDPFMALAGMLIGFCLAYTYHWDSGLVLQLMASALGFFLLAMVIRWIIMIIHRCWREIEEKQEAESVQN